MHLTKSDDTSTESAALPDLICLLGRLPLTKSKCGRPFCPSLRSKDRGRIPLFGVLGFLALRQTSSRPFGSRHLAPSRKLNSPAHRPTNFSAGPVTPAVRRLCSLVLSKFAFDLESDRPLRRRVPWSAPLASPPIPEGIHRRSDEPTRGIPPTSTSPSNRQQNFFHHSPRPWGLAIFGWPRTNCGM